MTREIEKNWFIIYFNDSNQYHQEDDKPSVISFNGNISFLKNGKDHRKDKPSRIWNDGTLLYYEHDEFVKRIQR